MKRRAPVFFFLGGCLLLALGLAAFGAAFLLRGGQLPDAFFWKAPLEQVDNRALVPATVLLPLTGVDSADALSIGLDKTHLENAYAIIAYDPTLTDPARIGALLQLAARYAAVKDHRKAAACYQAAALLATLSPALSDPARVDTYLQVSAGLRALEARDAARWAMDRAYLVAQYSPALRREARTRRLEQVADGYAELGVSGLAAQARAKSIETLGTVTETTAALARMPFVPAFGKLAPSTAVQNASNTRIAAARQLMDDLQSSPPKGAADWPQDSVAQLSDALLEEDRARQAYYDQQFPQAKEPPVQMALLRDRIQWLSLKYRTARGGFAYNLVSEWSKNPSAIAEAWSETWNELFRLYATQATGLPQAREAKQAAEDVIRQQLFTARWGWFKSAPEGELDGALKEVSQDLIDAAVPALHLDMLTRDGRTTYLLLPDELYGQKEKALPK